MAVLLANNATSELASSVTSTQTTISVSPGEGSRFPSPTGDDWFPVTLIKASGVLEVCRCTGRSNDTMTIERAQEGTSAQTFSAGDRIQLRLTTATLAGIKTALEEYADTAVSNLDGDLGDASRANRGDLVPPGVIWMWSGSIASIPSGWALCNGSNGTPDLRGLFVVGAGGSYGVGATGGANSVTLTESQIPSHNHSASTGSAGSHSHSGSTNTTGAHSHNYEEPMSGSEPQPPASGIDRLAIDNSNGTNTYSDGILSAGNHSHSLSINSNGAHTHSVSVGSTGGGGSHENRPPYYALAFIMRLAWS